jgi:hypothetical protein
MTKFLVSSPHLWSSRTFECIVCLVKPSYHRHSSTIFSDFRFQNIFWIVNCNISFSCTALNYLAQHRSLFFVNKLWKYQLPKAKCSFFTVTLSTLISDTHNLFSLKPRDHVSHQFKAAGEIVLLYALILHIYKTLRQKTLKWMVLSICWIWSFNFPLSIILIWYCCSQLFHLCQISRVYMLQCCPLFWWWDMNIYSVFSAFTSDQPPH